MGERAEPKLVTVIRRLDTGQGLSVQRLPRRKRPCVVSIDHQNEYAVAYRVLATCPNEEAAEELRQWLELLTAGLPERNSEPWPTWTRSA